MYDEFNAYQTYVGILVVDITSTGDPYRGIYDLQSTDHHTCGFCAENQFHSLPSSCSTLTMAATHHR